MNQTFFSLLILFQLSASIYGMGMNQKPEFDIGEFHSVQVDIPCTMTLKRGHDFLMEIEDRNNHLKELDIYNDKGTLVFKLKEINLLRRIRKEDLGIILTLPEWKGIKLSSSADISSDDEWENDEISVRTSASGDIRLNKIMANHAEIKISASGDIHLKEIDLKGALDLSTSASGDIEIDSISCASVKIKNSASGEIDLGEVETSGGQFQLRSSGSGDNFFAAVKARNIQLIGQSSGEIKGNFNSDSLEIKLSGSGDARLQGTTGIASLQTSGSASIEASEMIIGEASVTGSGSGDVSLKRGTVIRGVSFTGSGNLITR